MDFIDHGKGTAVVRVTGKERLRVSIIKRDGVEIAAEEGVALSDQEKLEIETFSELLRSRAKERRRLDALQFPEMARLALEFSETATEIERNYIFAAIDEASRRLKRVKAKLGLVDAAPAPKPAKGRGKRV